MNIDRLGTIAGMACAVHCALSGVAIGLLSTLGLAGIASAQTEIAFLTVTFGLGFLALFTGLKKHSKKWPAAVFFAGIGLIIGSHLISGSHGHLDHSHSSPVSTLLAVMGACCLVSFHVINQKLAKASH